MRHHLKLLTETLIATIGITSTIIALMGSAACLGCFAGIAIIETDENFNSHHSLLYRAMLYSIGLSLPTLSASGMLLITVGSFERSRNCEPETIKYCPRPLLCKGCQHFHGMIYNDIPFICAMHPHGILGKQCPDRETEPSVPPTTKTFDAHPLDKR